MKTTTLEIIDLTKNFRNKTVLKNINFSWEKGILGLIGPNGAGKSTLIKILSTLISPTNGQVLLFGKDVKKKSFDVRRCIGVLHENPVFHPNLKVMSSLIWVARLRGYSKSVARTTVEHLLKYFEIYSAKNYQIKELSAGMRQKYGLIYATIGTPPLIILDEPTSNLDPSARQKYEKYITQISKNQQCSFLISSHILGELNRICDSYIFLFDGKINISGTRTKLISKISKKRYRVTTCDVDKIIELFNKHCIEIENIKEKEITVITHDYEKLIQIKAKLLNQSNIIEIYLLETEIESLYRELSQANKSQVGE